ncbi:MAG: Helix-turn-helix protein [Bacteroidetes bacterium]|nr:Helix-turn-helix protein [Bacteroidota bacterium]
MRKKENLAFLVSVGKNLRVIRISKGFTQRAFAFSCDIEPGSLNRIEHGKSNTSLSLVKTMCDVLGIKPVLLFEIP